VRSKFCGGDHGHSKQLTEQEVARAPFLDGLDVSTVGVAPPSIGTPV
jgi:hypothetical protein